jgi:tripartite-type tricarboxylate transporter receptor subunit TctC
MPDVPTTGEQGYPMNFGRFYYCAMPKDTPDDVVNVFAAALEKVSQDPDYIKECEDLYINPVYMTPDECYDFAKNQLDYLPQNKDALITANKEYIPHKALFIKRFCDQRLTGGP